MRRQELFLSGSVLRMTTRISASGISPDSPAILSASADRSALLALHLSSCPLAELPPTERLDPLSVDGLEASALLTLLALVTLDGGMPETNSLSLAALAEIEVLTVVILDAQPPLACAADGVERASVLALLLELLADELVALLAHPSEAHDAVVAKAPYGLLDIRLGAFDGVDSAAIHQHGTDSISQALQLVHQSPVDWGNDEDLHPRSCLAHF